MSDDNIQSALDDVHNRAAQRQDVHTRLEEHIEETEFESEPDTETDAPETYEEPEEHRDEGDEDDYSPLKLNTAAKQLETDIAAVQAAHDQIDWERLQKEDWPQYQILRTKFQDAEKELQQRAEQLQETAAEGERRRVQREYRKVLQTIPEWRNPQVAQREKDMIISYMKRRGWTLAEINRASARDVLTFRDAALKERFETENRDLARRRPAKKTVVKRPTGLSPEYERVMESNAKRYPHGSDATQLRLLRGGFV